jgi:asparagine synthase (glutamine-hydrolysing)
MRSDVPVGAYLSGGIDSSLVTALASKRSNGPLKTFTGAFHEGPQFNETEYAKMVSDQCGADYFEIYPQSKEFTDLLPKLVYHMDEPVAGPGLFPQYIVSRFASEHVKVALGGQGGDEIFGGYVRYIVAYLEQALKGAIYESHEEGEHIVSLNSILPNLPYLKQYVPMMKSFWKKDAFEPMDSRYFNLIDRNGWPHDLYTPDFQDSFNKMAIFNRYSNIFNHPDTLSYFNKMTHFDMVSSLPALLHVEDRVSMANSLESRVPLLDRRIVDLVTSIPPAMKFKGAEMKYILKKASGSLLPERVVNRKDKMGFPVPLHIWAKNGAGDFFRDILLGKKCLERGIINKAGIETLVNSEQEFGRQLWGLMNLELWFEQFIDAN